MLVLPRDGRREGKGMKLDGGRDPMAVNGDLVTTKDIHGHGHFVSINMHLQLH